MKELAGWVICVFYLEEVVNMVLGSIIPHVGVGVLPHHVIDGVHDSCHLLDREGGEEIWANQTSPETTNRTLETQLSHKPREREQFEYLPGDAAIFVEIVQIKGPVEFICDGSSQDDGQTYDEVLNEDKQNPTMV